MPPRKPKQPARKPAKKGAAKKKTSPKGIPQKYNPETHVLAADGSIHPRKIVSGTGTAVGVNRETKSTDHLELEARMAHAIHQAHADGITDPEKVRERILAARDEHLEGK